MTSTTHPLALWQNLFLLWNTVSREKIGVESDGHFKGAELNDLSLHIVTAAEWIVDT